MQLQLTSLQKWAPVVPPVPVLVNGSPPPQWKVAGPVMPVLVPLVSPWGSAQGGHRRLQVGLGGGSRGSRSWPAGGGAPPPLMGGKVRAAGERGRSRAGEPLLDWGGQLLGPGPIRVWVAEVSHRKGRIGGGIPHWICFVACGRTGFFFLTLRLFSPAETQKSTPLWEPF